MGGVVITNCACVFFLPGSCACVGEEKDRGKGDRWYIC